MRALALLGITAVVSATPSARADGIPAYVDRTGWHLLEEDTQHAIVALHGGRESMLLQVAAKGGADGATPRALAWVVPIPAAARDVRADVLVGFPELGGVEPAGQLASHLRAALALLSASQIFTVPALLVLSASRDAAALGAGDVSVELRVVRHGVEVQVVSAESSEALAAHLRGLGIELPAAALHSLGAYARPGASYLVQRIADLPAYLRATGASSDGWSSTPLAVWMDFPTAEGFFPIAASSALPGHSLEIVVTSIGFVTPIDPVPSGTETRWYVGNVTASPEARRALGVHLARGFAQRYTRMRLRTRPGALAGDLRFRPGASAVVEAAAGWVSHPLSGTVATMLLAVTFAVLSMLSALLSRRVWPAPVRPSRAVCAALGLANFGTLLGVVLASLIRARRVSARSNEAWLFALATGLVFCSLLFVLFVATYAIG